MQKNSMTENNIINLELERFFLLRGKDSSLRNAGWRGCVLDRDNYSNLRLPKLLWENMIECAGSEKVDIWGYFDGLPDCETIKSKWSDYSLFMNSSDNYSPEYVIHDEGMDWIIWADLDVTTVAMSQYLADALDSRLQQSETSLMTLTKDSFPSFDESTFVARIVGCKSD